MTTVWFREVLGWCIVLNGSLLLCWFFAFIGARNEMLQLHRRWFNLSPEHFDTIHYAGIGLFKLGILLFNVVPYFALRLAEGK